ncbi:AB hydrolase-1 domain-containing protein [Mycena sanguinolenta]|uniref:AB hydrolase-1 domain-containing protein n=1 Tax=Mycena sanguinolenta TaxID=230812 RepID=A0A8H7D494_9AGAR|nr:AB hydrolase-1 domain-containing protein [Mycena sanguinolenta]
MISFSRPFLFSAILLSHILAARAADTFLWDRVPLNYSDPTVGTAALAVIRLPANVSEAQYRGPLLFNPGGPGGSGVDSLVANGPSFQAVLGSQSNQYDIVSFDPRGELFEHTLYLVSLLSGFDDPGVRYSTPIAVFFETDAERALWNAAAPFASLNASSDAIPEAWGRAHLLGAIAAQRDASQILKYLTTDNVARDMLQITQKFGFEKLKYYGISYGSVLGATFATMFPDKVERILIDGVLDADAWFSAKLTIEVTDTDKVLQTFFDGCAAAGPDLCAFHKPTAMEIADRLTALTASIRTQPIPVLTPAGYGLVDYSLLRLSILGALYHPFSLFPTLAQGLAALENGDGSILYSISQGPPFQCDCANNTASPPTDDSTVAIECGDAIEVTDTIEEVTEFYQNAAKTSQFADGWKVYREDRFKGPVAAANTSFPLLLVTTTADPDAPKAAALKTQAGFPGSVLLTQDGPGHTSLSAPSLCTTGYFRQYFLNGILPAPGTVCPVDATLFGASANSTTKRAALNADEEEVLAALKVISDSVLPAITRKMRGWN